VVNLVKFQEDIEILVDRVMDPGNVGWEIGLQDYAKFSKKIKIEKRWKWCNHS
jgi:hypothetical protein